MAILLFIIFAFISIANVFCEKQCRKRGRYFTKPLLMPLLAVVYLTKTSTPDIFIVLGLICGFLGDFFLMWSQKPAFFAAGLGAFLIGHVFYIAAFMHTTNYLSDVPGWLYLTLLPYMVLSAFIFKRLSSHLSNMKIPAFLYMSTIMLMSFICLTRVCSIKGYAFWLPYIGSLLFLMSDSILAFDNFKTRIRNGNVYVMTTYILAQFFIVLGFIV